MDHRAKSGEVGEAVSRTRKRVLMMANARKFLAHVARYAAEHNWRITIVNDGLPPRGWKGDGALLSYSRSKAQMDYAAHLARSGEIPCVGMSYAVPKIRMPRVLAGFEGAAKLAARCGDARLTPARALW